MAMMFKVSTFIALCRSSAMTASALDFLHGMRFRLTAESKSATALGLRRPLMKSGIERGAIAPNKRPRSPGGDPYFFAPAFPEVRGVSIHAGIPMTVAAGTLRVAEIDSASCNWEQLSFLRAGPTYACNFWAGESDGDDRDREVVPLRYGADVLREAWPDAEFPVEPGGADRAGQTNQIVGDRPALK
jgi:hypothetical protein